MTGTNDQVNQQFRRPLVLGVETSCDETAAAIVSADKKILAHRVLSQIDDHAEFGGVVPEIAARQHISHLDHLLKGLMDDAALGFDDLDAIAATTGPGLVGGLMVGVMTAKAIARAAGKPFVAVNHLEGHALTARLVADIEFPFLLLLVSGGHCQILSVRGVGDYERLGSTIDDAAGEAFDKTAKLLGLAYPGGPSVEKEAGKGDPARFKLPKPMVGKPGCDFSFSGLKTAVRRLAEDCVAKRGMLYEDDRADICAAFQMTIGACFKDRLRHAVALFRADVGAGDFPLVVAGGVAANAYLRGEIEALAASEGLSFHAPPLSLCTDNGAMIAWAGLERFRVNPGLDDRDVSARPRWPLDERAAPIVGSGKKGAKA
ncbi:tRNA (adenosine(37)-N6)-threonylcarbamoyltransferase complex transferase subunit TsaD [Kordiimonas marina]|uniref:tRNA (adenosine(37)-N6)-threonylcarbamoyltransferase complex transferase subunit TsaD n=1 Tax=Kordiimonas marina TaxID=2872312 RepID=UPI001FF3ED1F|nr:tRNA (adenosine(37)-N6)-threonylcarbamoyltransferase complex transferase subunit TsaD [Kordiimonas marina]MCJ9430599.1 tRNA (adenosine(37)-N6)-threonylcarbamoyltransferase complex transferase subunit TsaD [Kordiimonas marina]